VSGPVSDPVAAPGAADAPHEVILVRHGRSAHEESGWLDVDGLRRWMTAYDAAEIALHHPPPRELVETVARAARLVTSDLPRAIASAAMLAPGREAERMPLLREAPLETPELPLPALGGLRMPLRGWALVLGARWLHAHLRGAPPPGVDAAALARADEAAGWLVSASADAGGPIVAITHATFRSLVAASLVRRGWRGPERRPFREWSAWRFAPAGSRPALATA
jgi:broad specificity phosphatase PhoE